jgi:hypothetical protein
MLMLSGVLCSSLLNPASLAAQEAVDFFQLKPTNVRIFAPNGQLMIKAALTDTKFAAPSTASTGGINMGGGVTDDRGFVAAPGNFTFGTYSIYVYVENVGYAYVSSGNVQATGAPPINVRLQEGGTLRVLAKEVVALAGRKKQTVEYPVGGAQVALTLLLPEQSADAVANTRGTGTNGVTAMRQQHREFSIATDKRTYDGSGMAVIRNIPPGRYAVTVTAMADYAPVVEEIEVTQGQPADLPVYLERRSISGLQITLQDQNGKPLRNKDVSLDMKPSAGATASGMDASRLIAADFLAPRYVHTDTRGNVMLYPLKVGRYTIEAHAAWGDIEIPRTEVEVTPEGSQITLVAQVTGKGD